MTNEPVGWWIIIGVSLGTVTGIASFMTILSFTVHRRWGDYY